MQVTNIAIFLKFEFEFFRVQAQQILGGKQHNILETIKKVWKDNGIRGFYRGITPAVCFCLFVCLVLLVFVI